MMAELDILNGFVGKVISDCIDITIEAIKKADKNRKSKNQTMETRIYQVTIDALNVFPYNKYKRKEQVYDATESILKELKGGNGNYKESVREGLNMLSSDITGDVCEDFLELLCYEICKEENQDLALGYIIYQEEQIIEQQQQMNRHVKEEFEESHQNEKEILEEVSGVKHLINEMYGEKGCKTENKIPIVNRAEEYAQRWNKNVFLNDFDEEDENTGVNIKLKDIYIDECLPHYIWKTNLQSKNKLKNLLKKYIIDNNKKMLLILGQPGIGKSTLITWIIAKLVENKDDIYVYQFASDLKSVNWQSDNILSEILRAINLDYSDLKNKTLILDGFDEIHIGSDRERILNILNQELKRRIFIKTFSLIITCRENYIYDLKNIECDYITLQAWNRIQINSFCGIYSQKTGEIISEDKIHKILENKEVFGIPLILYMILALNVDIEKSSSKMDIYDQIFSLKRGGIYDRCYDTEHRINKPEIKKYIHETSQKIAFWIFENNADKAFIYQKNFKEICEAVMLGSEDKSEDIQSDTLIGSYFKINHCEGKLADEVNFVHRSIYEYFVSIYFFESINNLTSKEEVAGKLGELLKNGCLSEQILEFIKYKFDSMKSWNLSEVTKDIFNIMIKDGMTYHMRERYKSAIEKERRIFSNMLEIVGLWNSALGEIDDKIITYLQCNRANKLKLKGIKLNIENYDLEKMCSILSGLNPSSLSGVDLNGADLSGADLSRADLSRAKLSRADLSGADLSRAKLSRADLNGADLSGADLSRADLSGADLSRAKLSGADLNETIFDEKQVNMLHKIYDLSMSRVVLSKSGKIIRYQEYCIKNRKILKKSTKIPFIH